MLNELLENFFENPNLIIYNKIKKLDFFPDLKYNNLEYFKYYIFIDLNIDIYNNWFNIQEIENKKNNIKNYLKYFCSDIIIIDFDKFYFDISYFIYLNKIFEDDDIYILIETIKNNIEKKIGNKIFYKSTNDINLIKYIENNYLLNFMKNDFLEKFKKIKIENYFNFSNKKIFYLLQKIGIINLEDFYLSLKYLKIIFKNKISEFNFDLINNIFNVFF